MTTATYAERARSAAWARSLPLAMLTATPGPTRAWMPAAGLTA
jgi:hypothetical protein